MDYKVDYSRPRVKNSGKWFKHILGLTER